MGSQGGAVQEPKLQESLTRQGSLYSLTLDEVQNQLGDLGKPLGSMNLDELLKSVWSAEATQGTGTVTDSSGAQAGQGTSASSLPQQGSLNLFNDLSKKTVDEVWKDIQQKKNGNQERANQERHPTLGEMTLEDFLVKAGVVAKSPSAQKGGVAPALGVDPIAPAQHDVSQHVQWMQYQLPSMQQPQQRQHQLNTMAVFMPGHGVQQPLSDSGNTILEAAYENQMIMSPSSLMGTLSDTQTPGRKRVAPEDMVEKTVERRQKRMIKNRESAARSRARRQAYTHELENKVSRLEEENERLRRQKEIEKILPTAPSPEPKNQLRRTSSASF